MSEKETVFNKKKNVSDVNGEEKAESSTQRFYYNLISANTADRKDFDHQLRLEKIRKNSFIRWSKFGQSAPPSFATYIIISLNKFLYALLIKMSKKC